jgi:hypothetical protein
VNINYTWCRPPSGYTGLYPDDNPQQGANGLIFNQQQQLVLAQHGDRRLALFVYHRHYLFIADSVATSLMALGGALAFKPNPKATPMFPVYINGH